MCTLIGIIVHKNNGQGTRWNLKPSILEKRTMGKNFPMGWETWKQGVKSHYSIQRELETKQAAGESLSEEEKQWLVMAKMITTKYHENGHKKRGR